MLGIRKREAPVKEIIKSEVGKMGNVIYKPEVKYPDENGEVRIPDEAIAVQRQVEKIKVSNCGIESDIVRVYYSYLIPVSEEVEPVQEVKEEQKKPVILAKRR